MNETETNQNSTPEQPIQPESPIVEPAASATDPLPSPVQPTSIQEVAQSIYPEPTTPMYGQPQQPIGSGGTTNIGKAKKLPLKLAVLGGVVLLILVGVIGGYLWYQSPNKVVSDGIMSAVEAKTAAFDGTVSTDGDGYSVTTALKGGYDTVNADGSADATITVKLTKGDLSGKNFTVDGSFVAAKDGTVYIRANNLTQVADVFVDSMINSQVSAYQGLGSTLTPAQINQAKTQAHAYIDPIVKKFDNQWIKISPTDSTSGMSSSTKCFQNEIAKLQADKTTQKQVIDTFNKDNFIASEKSLGTKDGSVGYELSFDKSKEKQFNDDLNQTSFGKAMASCDTSSGSTGNSSPTDSLDGSHVEVWVGQWSHALTRVVMQTTDVTSKANVNLDMNLQLGKSTTVTTPKNAESFNDLSSTLFGM